MHVQCCLLPVIHDDDDADDADADDADDDDDDDGRIYFNVASVLGLQGHVRVIVGSRSSRCSETFISQSSCKIGQKVQSSVYCEKLAMTAMNVLSPADCSRQMQQPPGRLGRQ